MHGIHIFVLVSVPCPAVLLEYIHHVLCNVIGAGFIPAVCADVQIVHPAVDVDGAAKGMLGKALGFGNALAADGAVFICGDVLKGKFFRQLIYLLKNSLYIGR